MNEKTENKNINVRVTPKLRKVIDRFLEIHDIYLNISDFIREAVREKIQREAPYIYEELLDDNQLEMLKEGMK